MLLRCWWWRSLCAGCVQQLEVMQIPHSVQCLLYARQQISGLSLILVVIENQVGFAVDIVLQPVDEDQQALFSGEYHGIYYGAQRKMTITS